MENPVIARDSGAIAESIASELDIESNIMLLFAMMSFIDSRGGGYFMQFVEPIRDKKKINSMKKILRASSLRNEMLFVFGINTALRVSDLLALRVGDVIDEKGSVKDAVAVREKKTDKSKLFRLNDSVKSILQEYVKAYSPDLEAPLFPSRKGGRAISRIQAWQVLNQAAGELGLERVGTHTLRKTFGYHVYRQTGNLGLVQKLLNHSNSKETLRYIGVDQDQMDEAYFNLNL